MTIGAEASAMSTGAENASFVPSSLHTGAPHAEGEGRQLFGFAVQQPDLRRAVLGAQERDPAVR